MSNERLLQAVTASVLAVMSIGSVCFIEVWTTMHGQSINQIPDWLALLIGGISGAYFGHIATQNGARQAGTAAAQVAIDAATHAHDGTPL